MIPDLPQGMLESDVLDFYDKLSSNLTDQATIHIHWWTHRQNPSVCWICDMITLLSKVLTITASINTKSPTDMQTNESSASESDSDAEIENYNVDEERTPEYEVEDAQQDMESEQS